MTITITATPEATSPPRVVVSVVTDVPLVDQLEVYRIHDMTGQQFPLILPDRISLIAAGTWSDVDRHAPYNQSVRYKAVAGSTSGVTGQVAATSTSAWLHHASDPDLSVLLDREDVHLGPISPPAYASRSALFQIVDGPQVSLGGGRRDQSGTLSVVVRTDEKLSAVRALLADDNPVLFDSPYSQNDLGWMWFQPGTWTPDNAAGLRNHVRTVQIPYTVVAQPDLDLIPDWTWDDLAATGWTWAQAATHYTTFIDMKLDRRH